MPLSSPEDLERELGGFCWSWRQGRSTWARPACPLPPAPEHLEGGETSGPPGTQRLEHSGNMAGGGGARSWSRATWRLYDPEVLPAPRIQGKTAPHRPARPPHLWSPTPNVTVWGLDSVVRGLGQVTSSPELDVLVSTVGTAVLLGGARANMEGRPALADDGSGKH